MNQIVNLLKVIILIVVQDQCYADSSEVTDSSSLDIEVRNKNDYANSSLAPHHPHPSALPYSLGQVDTNSTKRNSNLVKRNAGKEENNSISSETGLASKEDGGCADQPSRSNEEEDDESKSTLVDYPFSVTIQKKGSHYVTGALIDKNWILSVAGEFYNVRESLKLFRARLGSVDCKRGGILVPIKKIEIHPYYIHRKPNYDIALLRMATPVKFSDVISPIGISNISGKILSAKFMTTYWPRIVLNGKTIPENAKERIKHNSMRVSTQRLIPEDECQNIMAAINEHINESSLCLKSVITHHSVCMPDAGAPVIAHDGLWGITSGWVSPKCPNFAGPTIFTRLSIPSVQSWLDIHLRV